MDKIIRQAQQDAHGFDPQAGAGRQSIFDDDNRLNIRVPQIGQGAPGSQDSSHVVQVPNDQQAVGGRAGIDPSHGAVIIRQIGGGGRAQVVDVELRVGGTQGVNRPPYLENTPIPAPVSLEPFEPGADPQYNLFDAGR